MKKMGLFLNGLLMKEYPYTNEGYSQALNDIKFAWEETEEYHEIKIYKDINEVIPKVR